MKPSPSRAHAVVALLSGAALLLSSLPAFATDIRGIAPSAARAPGNTSDQPVRGTGVVKAVDNAQGTVTLAHDPIKSINWPSMTMEFKVRDKTLLDTAKTGARVDFTLEKVGNDYIVTSMKSPSSPRA